ncbi:MAG: methyl-accepting chemotaxis protein [Ostreibacterium sp.]
MNKKRNILKNLTEVQYGSLPRVVLLFLALLSLVFLIYFAYQNYKESAQNKALNAVVNQQIDKLNRFSVDYKLQLQGKTIAVDNIKKGISQFENLLRDQERGGFSASTISQQPLLSKIRDDFESLKILLQVSSSTPKIVVRIGQDLANISILSEGINLLVKTLNNAAVLEQNDLYILNDLSSLSKTKNNLRDLMDYVTTGKNVSNIQTTLTQELKSFVAAINGFKLNLNEKSSTIIDPSNKTNVLTLENNLKAIQLNVTDLLTYLPEYLITYNGVEIVDQKSMTLIDFLHSLKEVYSRTELQPFSSLPFSYIQLLVALTLLAFISLILWILLQLANSAKLRNEAVQLRKAAEERTENDQGAILRLLENMEGLSEGDLTIDAQVTEDSTGAIADSINFVVENMRGMVGTIMRTSDEITHATKNSQNTSRLLSEISGEQSRQIGITNATINKMVTSLYNISENTDASVDIAHASVDTAQEGRVRVHSTIKSMINIRENIQDTAKRIKRLGESSQEIGDIVEIIKGIADQTNILALNATIQATAAGEAGRGFAVVADEVQHLAERSTNATKRIEVLVKTIQADTTEAVTSMENSTTQVVTGTNVAEEAGQSLDKIENVSQSLANLIVNVSKATKNAASMAGGLEKGMDKLSELNHRSVKDVTKSVHLIDNLGELSNSLRNSVSGFKLPTTKV